MAKDCVCVKYYCGTCMHGPSMEEKDEALRFSCTWDVHNIFGQKRALLTPFSVSHFKGFTRNWMPTTVI